MYGAKKTYPCGWESRIRALGTLYGGTRVSNCWCLCDAPCSPRLATCLPAALLPSVVRLPCRRRPAGLPARQDVPLKCHTIALPCLAAAAQHCAHALACTSYPQLN